MKIGWLMPGGYAVVPRGDGRKVQALHQVAALEALGHEVVRLSPWNEFPDGLDVLHIFEGAFGNIVGAYRRPPKVGVVSLVPALDSNTPYWLYRAAAVAGSLTGNLLTNQGVHRMQSRRSDLVIARSESEKQRLIHGLGIDPAKTGIEIVLNGMTPPTPLDAAQARQRLGFAEDYVLHVSVYTDARKNLLRLIEAINQTPYPLVIAGRAVPGKELERIKALAAKNPRVRLMGFVEYTTLQDLYAACKVFALPSHNEGTGLVALEAAAQGASVVITKMGGPPDYFGPWTQYVDPYSVPSIREALKKAWDQPRTGELQKHVLANLTWEQSARSLAAAFQKHLDRKAAKG
ncbi:MAG: glycosyltransferase [Planctomycetota bacterium]|nr:glycosyltransferase [Planctomycetota bacterium]